MRIGIVGFGREGEYAYSYFGTRASSVYIYDKNTGITVPANAAPRLGENYLDLLEQDAPNLDIIIRSPGVALWHLSEVVQQKITTITKDFFDVCPCPIIGITGTKGKGTTATLTYEILKQDGKDVYLVGNIGTPALSVLPKLTPNSIVVYELSSFQLFDLHKSPHIAVCLLVTEDHLDWHRDLEHYHESKGNIFKHQKESNYAIWFADNDVSTKLSSYSKSHNKIPYGKKSIVRVENNMFMYDADALLPISEAALPGVHNQENICAAIAATYHLVTRESIIQAIKTQGSLAYHIEDKGIIHGIQFINDSFSTNPTATEVAVYATAPKNTILLIGGVDRGLHLDPHVRALANTKHITHVVCYGSMRERLFTTLTPYTKNISVCDGNLRTTLQHAISLATDGTTILFSPGAPSFDMFTDYKARGDAFNALLDDFKQNLL